MSVHHKSSWASLSAAIVVTIFFAVNLIFSMKGNIILYSTEMMALARNVFGIAVVFQALMFFINFVSKDEPEEKEIARSVSMRANQTTLRFLVFAIACCAIYLIYVSDTHSLLLSPLVCAHLLVSVLLGAWILKHTAELVIYHRSYKSNHFDRTY